jgi:hypothetical protein
MPRTIGVLIFPDFQLLDAATRLEAILTECVEEPAALLCLP